MYRDRYYVRNGMNFKRSHILLAVLVLSSSFDSSASTFVQNTKNTFAKIKNSKTAHITALVLAAVALTGLTVFGARQAYLSRQNKGPLTEATQIPQVIQPQQLAVIPTPSSSLESSRASTPEPSIILSKKHQELAGKKLEQQQARVEHYAMKQQEANKYALINEYLRAAGANDLDAMYKLERLNPNLPNEKDQFGFTPLMAAARHNALTAGEYLTKKQNVDVNASNDDGTTALMIAALNRSQGFIDMLFQYGAVDKRDSTNTGYKEYEIGSVTSDIRKHIVDFDTRTYRPHKRKIFTAQEVFNSGVGKYPTPQGTTEIHMEEPSGTVQIHDGN